MKKAIFAVILTFGFTGMAQAQNTEPCGPKSDLPANLSNNVASDSRCFELRMYTVDLDRVGQGDFKGDIDMLHQRFREQEIEIFEKHGAEIIAVWQNLGEENMLVWMLGYRDRVHREQVWEGFRNDPDWDALLAKYNVPIQRPQVFFMSATDYSALK